MRAFEHTNNKNYSVKLEINLKLDYTLRIVRKVRLSRPVSMNYFNKNLVVH